MLPIIDLHCDTLSKLAPNPHHFLSSENAPASHVFFSGLKSSGVVLQCFALFTDLGEGTTDAPLTALLQQLTCFQTLLSLTDGQMTQVCSYADLERNLREHRLSALLTLEESCLSKTPVSMLPLFYSLGIRMATLTWNHPNLLGTPAHPAQVCASVSPAVAPLLRTAPPTGGLTPAGFDFIAEAERLGILIDVSHLSDTAFYEVAACSKKAFLASHSNARSICDVPRNLSDDMLRTLAEHGGVVGLNLHEPFLLPAPASADDLLCALVRHTKHILSVAGADSLALGTDFDGMPGNAAIPNVAHLPRLEDALKKAGLTSSELEKIFFQNALRLLKECL